MKTRVIALLGMCLVLAVMNARAGDLTIEITKGMDNPTAIAVVPFAWQGAGTSAPAAYPLILSISSLSLSEKEDTLW